ncbi:MAG TPA: adenosine kinase [Alphaproteobacteria bacterium]|jgi:sugar/nucleoside kinase (ribokinase family)
MTSAQYDVVGIGNAIVDVIARADDGFLQEKKLAKGAMMLIDEAQADALYAAMGPGTESSGGSAANTIAGIASLGGKGAFFGKVKSDQLGKVFAHDIRAIGVSFESEPATHGPATARCLIFVTPDAQRTMNTYLGACVNLGPEDVDDAVVKNARVTYLEGYLWDPPRAKEAFVKAAKIAHAAHRKVALTLSDAFCVDRHRASFRDLVAGHVDILFANENEIKSLYEVDSFDAALQAVRGSCEIACLTRSEKGSLIVAGEEVHVIDAERVGPVVDTTGAGDLYASGFLYGWTHGYGLARAGRIASVAAAEVISHVGARPQTPLKALVKQKLG